PTTVLRTHPHTRLPSQEPCTHLRPSRYPLFLFHSPAHPRDLPSFPTRRSSDLERRLFHTGEAAVAFEQRPDAGVGERIGVGDPRSEEHTSELQSRFDLVCRLLLEKKNTSRYKNCPIVPTDAVTAYLHQAPHSL